MKFEATFYLDPVSFQVGSSISVIRGKVHRYKPAAVKKFQDDLKYIARSEAIGAREFKKLKGFLFFYMEIRIAKRNAADKTGDFADTRFDTVNIMKPVQDALQGIVYTNDRQIRDDHCKIIYHDEPGIYVCVEEIE